jgi:hypothetical protein
MARRPIPSVNDDFATVLPFLSERGIIPLHPPPSLVENARRIHRATYSLILWRFRLARLQEHGKAFIEEMASDALQILPQAMMGYGKTVKLLTRGVIENSVRHIYFSDHPVEFARMNRESKWYIRIDDLFAYALIHPDFAVTEPRFDAINKLNSLYSELSAGVHGRRVQDLEMRLSLRRIRYDETTATKQTLLVERCAESCNFMIAVFHRDQMAKFEREDRRVILRTMSALAKGVWREVE